MSETVVIGGGESVTDPDGNLVPGSAGREVRDVVVSPHGESRIDAVDLDGSTAVLELLAPAGTTCREGEQVTVRGLVYRVKHAPFDWSVGRRPAVARHRPRVKIVVERGEG